MARTTNAVIINTHSDDEHTPIVAHSNSKIREIVNLLKSSFKGFFDSLTQEGKIFSPPHITHMFTAQARTHSTLCPAFSYLCCSYLFLMKLPPVSTLVATCEYSHSFLFFPPDYFYGPLPKPGASFHANFQPFVEVFSEDSFHEMTNSLKVLNRTQTKL